MLHFAFNRLFTRSRLPSALNFLLCLFYFSNPLMHGVVSYSHNALKENPKVKSKFNLGTPVSVPCKIYISVENIAEEVFANQPFYIRLCLTSKINHVKRPIEFPQCGLTSSLLDHTVQSLLPLSHRHAQIQAAITRGRKIAPTTR